MPDRPKRRKNKNKRKNNKNNNADVNKNNIEESDTLDETCSNISENITKENIIEVSETVAKKELEIKASSSKNSNDKIIKSNIIQVDENIKDTCKIYTEFEVNSPIKINSELALEEQFMNENLVAAETCPILRENNNIITELKEEANTTYASAEACPLSDQLPTNNEQNEEVSQIYIVEQPEQVTSVTTKCKLDNTKKSKSCDNDDCPTIVDITDDSNIQNDDTSLTVINHTNVLITSEESDIEWENVHHFNLPQTQLIRGILSSDTIPFNIVHCDEIKSLSPQEEQSLRNYLQTLNLSTSPANTSVGDIKTEIEQIINREIKYRLRKKGLTEDTTFIRTGPARSLAVIDEEGSGDSSKTSRRHSYLNDKISDNEDLEDDVFESKPARSVRCGNIDSLANNSRNRLIPQPCILVDAKLKEPEISEARGDWSMKTVEKMTGAELVYLTDSSSSTSSIYDLNDDAEKREETDVSVRIITPTIEVTDTESLLNNTFLTKHNDKNESKSCDNLGTDMTSKDNTNKNLQNVELHSNVDLVTHEIVVLSTDDIKTDLFVKGINEPKSNAESKGISENLKDQNDCEEPVLGTSDSLKSTDMYDLEIKVLKCELNNAINNLIKEVISDSENCKDAARDTITRQDSSSSLDSSQCTAKYNPTNSSLNDVSNVLLEDVYDDSNRDNDQIPIGSSHVKDVVQYITSKPPYIDKKIEDRHYKQPSKLRDICVKKITSFPFGDKILEELAHVSLRLQNMSVLASERNQAVKNEYTSSQINIEQHESRNLSEYKTQHGNEHSNIPPPILPRRSSLKLAHDEPIKRVPIKDDSKYECFSPSQKMLMEKTNTVMERDFRNQPNISETKNIKEKSISHPIIQTPLKSETGSRLLALLRDTSISNNLNTQTLEDKNQNNAKPQLKSKPHSETFSKRLLDEIDSTNRYKETTSTQESFSVSSSYSLKPLPPPKPKKLSTYCYESDEGSNFRGNSFRSSKKYFHYSTGDLNKEIEDDISSIQNMHRHCTNIRDKSFESSPRRPSLPKDLCDQQMEYIRQKEKEVDAELRRLEQEQSKMKNKGPRAPMISEDRCDNNQTYSHLESSINKDCIPPSQKYKNIGDSKLSSLFSSSQEELLREKMYSEYVSQMAEREQRKQQKVIKVTQSPANSSKISKSMPLLDNLDSKMNNRIEEEFISKARERWYKLGIRDPEVEDKNNIDSNLYREPKVIEHKIKVIEAGEEKDVQNLPSHMQEFVKFTVKEKEQDTGSTGESNAEKASAHVVVFCAVIILVLTVGKFLLQFLRNK